MLHSTPPVSLSSTPTPNNRRYTLLSRYDLSPQELDSLSQAFSLFDIQNSGYIGISQFKDIISNLNIASDPLEIESIAESVDLNHDSVIDFEEFVSAMVRHMPIEDEKTDQVVCDDAELFACFDKNRDGRISQNELEQVMLALGEKLTPEEVKDMMMEADVNKDGYIDFEEFKLLIKR